MRASMPFYLEEWKFPVFSLSKPIADLQRHLEAILDEQRPLVHGSRYVLREIS
jgi:hypothetical protein